MQRIWEEIEPGHWRLRLATQPVPVAKSELGFPNVISDTMPPTEQVDGRFYESKRAFRAVGRALGLTEVGNEKLPPKKRASSDPSVKRARQDAVRKAVAQYRSGVRPRTE